MLVSQTSDHDLYRLLKRTVTQPPPSEQPIRKRREADAVLPPERQKKEWVMVEEI